MPTLAIGIMEILRNAGLTLTGVKTYVRNVLAKSRGILHCCGTSYSSIIGAIVIRKSIHFVSAFREQPISKTGNPGTVRQRGQPRTTRLARS